MKYGVKLGGLHATFSEGDVMSTAGKKRVLIVDDEAALREVIDHEFRRAGWETLQADGGFEAFKKLQDNSVDLIVTDVRMAKGTGLQLLDSIQSAPLPRPVIVLISGYSEVDEYKAIKRGAAGFFLKPFHLRDFVDSVIKIFDRPDAAAS